MSEIQSEAARGAVMFDLATVDPLIATTHEELDKIEHCPSCGEEIVRGYGLAGGGLGSYVFCADGCDFMRKAEERADG